MLGANQNRHIYLIDKLAACLITSAAKHLPKVILFSPRQLIIYIKLFAIISYKFNNFQNNYAHTC